jgi:AraC-like DNA-binding protein
MLNKVIEAVNANVIMEMPTAALLPFVKRFVIVEFPFDRKLKLLPTSSFLAEFRFRGENTLDRGTELPRAMISGLWDTPRTRIYMGGSAILLAMFTEIGAMAFLRNSLDSFFNITTAMEEVLGGPQELNLIDEQLAEAEGHGQQIQIVESFLLEHLHNTRLDPIVSAAVGRMEQTCANIRIEELAQEMGLSQSALERRFRRNVGSSPKRFMSILRLNNAIRLRNRGHDFTSIAYSAGYTDQSHFINEFKRIMGLAPSTFFHQSTICRNAEFLQVAFTSN